MKILYVSPAPVTRAPTGELTSFLASVRYRVILPARQLVRRGHDVDIQVTPAEGWDAPTAQAMTADVAVFAKSFHRSDIALARSLRERGVKVVFDASDDYFDHPEGGPAFSRMIDLVDEVVASTDEMARTIRRRSGRAATVIGDPVEGRRRRPALAPRFPRLNLLWFGHPLSLDTLWPLVPRLAELPAALPWELQVVTTPLDETITQIEGLEAVLPPACAIRFTPWSIAATWQALAETDLVLIPSADDAKKLVKSQNRLLESIQAGRFVIADPIPSYRPFADFAWIGGDLIEGIVWAVDHPREAMERVGDGQRAIAVDWSSYAVADQWEEVLTGAAPTRPLRLNLGSAGPLLRQYVNIDAGDAPDDRPLDVTCDPADLSPFDDGAAEEIFAAHLVERLPPDRARSAVADWTRVLRPGGRLAIETPNLAALGAVLAAQPDGAAAQRTIAEIFGGSEGPRRWGYTPRSLADLLSEAGLRQIKVEAIRTRPDGSGDMRATAIKP